MDAVPEKRKRGRPPGSRNKPALYRPMMGAPPPTPGERLVPPSTTPGLDFRHPDPATMCSRQLSMLDWAQQALRNEMQRAMQSSGVRIDALDIVRLEKLSTTLVRTIEAMKRSSDLADELSKRMSAEQLLEAAIKKVEGQDLATLNYAIKRLRAHRERLAPVLGNDRQMMGENVSASAAIASLETE